MRKHLWILASVLRLLGAKNIQKFCIVGQWFLCSAITCPKGFTKSCKKEDLETHNKHLSNDMRLEEM